MLLPESMKQAWVGLVEPAVTGEDFEAYGYSAEEAEERRERVAGHIHSYVETDVLGCDDCERSADEVCDRCGYSVCAKCKEVRNAA